MVLILDSLRRFPDLEAPNLVAVDAADRYLLDLAAPDLEEVRPGELVVIGDHYGALTLGAADRFGVRGIRVHQDPRVSELALAANASAADLADAYQSHALDEALVVGARVVLFQLPRSLPALDEIAELLARYAAPDVVVHAGGRIKHMTTAMNDVLRDHFGEVRVSLARQKSRVVTATGPIRPVGDSSWPRRQEHPDLGIVVEAHGATFAGTKIDIGTRALLDVLSDALPTASSIVDLGCGSGILAVMAARERPAARVLATDQSEAAVRSARATAAANRLADRITVVRDDALAGGEEASCDLVLLNPPFHVDAAVEPGVARKLFEAAARVLRPGGELWTVYNSHLPHRAALRRLVGPTRQISRDPRFTVTASTRL